MSDTAPHPVCTAVGLLGRWAAWLSGPEGRRWAGLATADAFYWMLISLVGWVLVDAVAPGVSPVVFAVAGCFAWVADVGLTSGRERPLS